MGCVRPYRWLRPSCAGQWPDTCFMASTSSDSNAAGAPARRAVIERMINAEPHRLRYRSLSLGVHPNDADDVAQTAMLRAWRSAGALRTLEEGPLCSWLDAIARNAAIDLARSRKSHPISELDDETPSTENTESIVEMRSRLDAALQAVRGLPASLQVPILLSAVDGLSGPEIAERLGISPASVRQRLVRARKLLGEG